MPTRTAVTAATLATLAALVLTACTPATTRPQAQSESETITLLSVIDGDTVETSAGTVRLIGVDTPERGECGEDEARGILNQKVAPGDAVTLELPAGQNDSDGYGRLIRYVFTTAGEDLGLLQLQAGTAVARYDSRDGYPAHPREADYHAAQLATQSPDGAVVTVACAQPAPEPVAELEPAQPEAQAPSTDRWWEQYTSCTKLKKNTVGHPIGPFNVNDPAQAEIYDWFAHRTGNNGDGEGDGLACE